LSDTKIPLIINDKCIGTVGITHDITDVKIAEDVMLESQAKFRLYLKMHLWRSSGWIKT
jgi:hypothetical protein